MPIFLENGGVCGVCNVFDEMFVGSIVVSCDNFVGKFVKLMCLAVSHTFSICSLT